MEGKKFFANILNILTMRSYAKRQLEAIRKGKKKKVLKERKRKYSICMKFSEDNKI